MDNGLNSEKPVSAVKGLIKLKAYEASHDRAITMLKSLYIFGLSCCNIKCQPSSNASIYQVLIEEVFELPFATISFGPQ